MGCSGECGIGVGIGVGDISGSGSGSGSGSEGGGDGIAAPVCGGVPITLGNVSGPLWYDAPTKTIYVGNVSATNPRPLLGVTMADNPQVLITLTEAQYNVVADTLKTLVTAQLASKPFMAVMFGSVMTALEPALLAALKAHGNIVG